MEARRIRLEEILEGVARGTYHPDSKDVAKKVLEAIERRVALVSRVRNQDEEQIKKHRAISGK